MRRILCHNAGFALVCYPVARLKSRNILSYLNNGSGCLMAQIRRERIRSRIDSLDNVGICLGTDAGDPHLDQNLIIVDLWDWNLFHYNFIYFFYKYTFHSFSPHKNYTFI